MPNEDLGMLEPSLQQQQYDPQNDPQAIYADVIREEKVTNIISQISPDNLLEEIEHRIRGEKKNTMTKGWEMISPNSKPISQELVADFMSFLGAILNQNTSLSNFSAGEINNLMSVIIEWVGDCLTDNDKRYDLVGRYTEMDRIGHIICMTCFAVFKRAQNGMESRKMWGSLRVTENTSGQQQKKHGILDAFKVW